MIGNIEIELNKIMAYCLGRNCPLTKTCRRYMSKDDFIKSTPGDFWFVCSLHHKGECDNYLKKKNGGKQMSLNEIQRIKMALLTMSHADVENAQKAYDFVMADSKEPINQEGTTPIEMADGIYLIKKTGKPVLFAPGCNKKDCVAVGIKLGSKSIAGSLKDAADGKDIVLTDKEDKTKYYGYIDNCTDAVADWNGKANTKHLEEIGLNESIKLEAGQYIPAVGEMYLIYLHKKALNEALEAVGGEPIANDWYWTSTEYSATGAWYLTLNSGYMYYDTKATYAGHVRPVSAFII